MALVDFDRRRILEEDTGHPFAIIISHNPELRGDLHIVSTRFLDTLPWIVKIEIFYMGERIETHTVRNFDELLALASITVNLLAEADEFMNQNASRAPLYG